MKKYIIPVLITLFLIGCSKHGVNFKVKNNCESVLDSISISNGFNSVKIYGLKNNNLFENSFLDFNKSPNTIKNDGTYSIIVYSNGEKRSTRFGYFSNGLPLSVYYKLSVESDTILVTEHRNK